MKLKKFVSVLATISMFSSLGFTCVNAEHAENPTIHVYVTEAADIEAKTNYKIPEGYTPYMISYTIEGIDFSLNNMNSLAIDYTVSDADLEKVHTKTFSKAVNSGATTKRDLNGIYEENTGTLQLVSKKQLSFLSTDGIDVCDWDTYPDGSAEESLQFIKTLWYVKDGESITINYNTAITDGQTSSKIVLDDDTSFAEEINYSPAKITLGNAGPSDIPVEAIKLDQTAVELDLNGTKTATLTATVEPADATDPTVTWATSDENVATVVDGVVTAVATGEATITATAGEKSATCVVTVVDTTPKTLKPGDVIEGIDIAKNPGKEDNVFYYVKTVADGANAAGHAKITNVTLGESVTTSRTIAQLLGGEAAEGATIEGAIVVVISGPVGNAFDFEIVD